MKDKVIWIGLICLTVAAMLLTSCTTITSSTSPTPTTTTAASVTTVATTPTIISKITSITTSTGTWWDKLGKPQYGGELVLRSNVNIVDFDPYLAPGATVKTAWMERLHTDDWTLDPAIFNYEIQFRTYQYVKGYLAETWELSDPSTYVVHLRKGIHWQDIPPASGREFTADDVVYHFDREYGMGGGFTKPSPFAGSATVYKDLISVIATDKYTVVFKWKTPNPESIMETLQGLGSDQVIENPEAVKQWGDLNDWHHAIGTGPFILKDFVSSSSVTLVKNPNYWGYDERYPQNQLPYLDTLRILIITDDATAMAGLRTGKIDVIDGISFQNAQSIQKTNPSILQLTYPVTQASTVDPRNDVAPFNDIRVRKAMQLGIDLPTIAKTYYAGTAEPYPATLTSRYMKGYGFPYEQWPQDLKDEYAYNPTAAKKLLADAGYPNGFKTNIVADAAGDPDLLQIVKSYFTQIGIDMEIRPMDTASWMAFVATGHKEDQLAQRAQGSLGQTYEPLRQLNRFVTAYPANYNMVSDTVFDSFKPKAMADINIDDIKQVLRDANEYVARQHFAISLLQPNLFALYQPWFKGYSGQFGSIAQSQLLLGFYTSHFWIDQSLKKSMGH